MATTGAKQSSASLYVGDLSPEVTETTLFELFNQVGPVASIRVCRDTYRPNRSLGYAYVNFHNAAHADKALDTLNNTNIAGKPCRIMWSQRDPALRKSGVGNIFIKNLHTSIGIKELNDTFSQFGDILSCKIALNENGISKGFGFVHFQREADAADAISKQNKELFKGQEVFVGHFVPKKERNKMKDSSWTNVYIKNLTPDIDEETLKQKFSEYGTTLSVAVVPRDPTGFGFVNFESHEAAVNAVKALHKTIWNGKEIWCGRHQKKTEREAENRRRSQIMKMQRNSRTQGTNLYIKNLDDDIDDIRLASAFEGFGTIKSSKIMVNEKGLSRGFGFISFSNPDEARHAIETMNGHPLPGFAKPLYVALHEPKEIRRQKLVQHFARKSNQMNPIYPFFGGSGVQPPYVYSQSVPRKVTWAPPSYTGQYPVQVPMGPQGGGKYPNNRTSNQPPRPKNSNAPKKNTTADDPHSVLTTVMSVPEDQRKLFLGEQLYPIIHKLQPTLAGKITGMLLDSGWTVEALTSLISNSVLLKEKVNEAKEVLERAQKSGELAEARQ